MHLERNENVCKAYFYIRLLKIRGFILQQKEKEIGKVRTYYCLRGRVKMSN